MIKEQEVKKRSLKRSSYSKYQVLNEEGNKLCSKCKQWKDLSNFMKDCTKSSGYLSSCKPCNDLIRKAYYKNNKSTLIKKSVERERCNREASHARKLKYARSEKGKLKSQEYRKLNKYKYVLTPFDKLKKQVRARVYRYLKGDFKNKNFSASGCIDYTREELLKHFESRFTSGMTWDNYGVYGWHIDHIIPLKYFDLTKEEEVKKAWSLENLQPLWWRENISKGAKLNYKYEYLHNDNTTLK